VQNEDLLPENLDSVTTALTLEVQSMAKLYRYLATSDDAVPRIVRSTARAIRHFSLPAPRLVFKPILVAFLCVRAAYYFFMRVVICEPLFKAYCKQHGRGVHTGVYLHWVTGQGHLIVGNNVVVDGKCGFKFAARFSDRPTLRIGDNSGIGHGCSFAVGKSITIGRHCRIAGYVQMFDSGGHPADPASRLAGLPPAADEVRPIVIHDNVWIGSHSIVYPGVYIGAGSVVAAGSVVINDVPPNTLVAGNPARKIAALGPASGSRIEPANPDGPTRPIPSLNGAGGRNA
jgi:acetyltransferase-like isoleucine patch superfamily enzyme